MLYRKGLTDVHISRRIGTGVDRVLKHSDIPTVHKVAVEAIARRISVREDKRLSGAVPHVLEIGTVIKHFVEKRNQSHREVRVCTRTGRDPGGKGYMRFVISTVQVDAVPARREHNLKP